MLFIVANLDHVHPAEFKVGGLTMSIRRVYQSVQLANANRNYNEVLPRCDLTNVAADERAC